MIQCLPVRLSRISKDNGAPIMSIGIRPSLSGFRFPVCLGLLLVTACLAPAFAQGRSETLIRRLQDKDPQVRQAAIKEVKTLGGEAQTVVPMLVGMLKGPEEDQRATAAEALGNLGAGAGTATPALIEALKDPAASVLRHSAFAIGQVGVEARSAAPALGALLKDSNALVRANAAFALGRVGEAKSHLPSLMELLKDPNEN